jgi:hypothetical protein
MHCPCDDLESLAYTAFYLLRGNLPWRTSDKCTESMGTVSESDDDLEHVKDGREERFTNSYFA